MRLKEFKASRIISKSPSVANLITKSPFTKKLNAKALRRKSSSKYFPPSSILEKSPTNFGTLNYLNEEIEETISIEGLDSEDSQQLFTKYDTLIKNFDEDSRTIISKRVKDREIRFSNLSLGDDFT